MPFTRLVPWLAFALACPVWMPAQTPDASADTLQQLQDKLKAQEARLAALESAQPAVPKDKLGALSSGTAFNPRMSIILDGVYYRDNRRGRGPAMLEHLDGIGHMHSHNHDHGSLEQGINLRETEFAFSATISPYFDANVMMTVTPKGGVELEEAYFDTRMLPWGLKVRGGKFLSGIGYLNSQHPHQWDFVDGPLPIHTLLGEHGLMDTGARVTWLPESTKWYTQVGVECLQGRDQLFATSGIHFRSKKESPARLGQLSDQMAGPRLFTAFLKTAPELRGNHTLQVGTWGAWSRQHQEVHTHRINPADPASDLVSYGLEGNCQLVGADVVYKYDLDSHRKLKLVGEYLWQRKNLHATAYDVGNAKVTHLGQAARFYQNGLLLQAAYVFAPHWQAAARFDVTGLMNQAPDWGWEGRASHRWTVNLTRSLTEFSFLRLQWSRTIAALDGVKQGLNQFYLQYQHSLGSHGAHTF